MKFKTYYLKLMAILVVFYTPLFSQDILQPEWVVSRQSPTLNQDADGWGVDVDENGFIYWATDQFFFGQGFDILLYKFNADSNQVWNSPQTYGGPFLQKAFRVKVDGSRTYIVGRKNHSRDLASSDMLILAIETSTGDTLWKTVWDQGYGYEEVDDILIGDDGLYITGWTTGESTKLDIALLKLDFDGNILLINTWGTDLQDHQDGHAVMDDSFIYIAGIYESRDPLAVYEGRALLAKFSRDDLSYVNHITFGREDPWLNFENALGMTSDGTFLYLVGVTSLSFTNWDIFVTKYDKNLNRLWHKLWGGTGPETARAITLADNGHIYIAGNSKSFGPGDIAIALLDFSAGGEFLGYHIWGGIEAEDAMDIVSSGNYLYITGRSKTLHPQNNFAAFLMKVAIDSISAVVNQAQTTVDFKLEQNYPNPFNPETTIEYRLPRASNIEIIVFNLQGQKIGTLSKTYQNAGYHKIKWGGDDQNGFSVSSGVYLYQIKAGNNIAVRKMVLLR